MSSKQPPLPPKAPEIARKVSFYRLQAIGVPILSLLPILAVFQVFDTRPATTTAEQNALTLECRYPSRLRHRTVDPLVVTLRNDSGRELTTLEIRMSSDYFEGFDQIAFHPEPKEIDTGGVVFEMSNVGAGASRRIEATFEADTIGFHNATIEASTELGRGPTAKISTFVLP